MIKTSKKALLTLAPALMAFGLMNACGRNEAGDSAVKVTNGVVIKDTTHPATVLLVMNLPEGQGLCTGTFVNDSQVVTAGHCVEGLSKTKPEVYFASTRNGKTGLVAQAVSFARNPKYNFSEGVGPDDISVITFPAHSAPAISPLAAETPAVGSEFTIVGYGNNKNYQDQSGVLSGDGAGVKREGNNFISSTEGGMLAFAGVTGVQTISDLEAGTYVSSGEGDSGGPLLVDGALAGVTSGGGLGEPQDGIDISISLYVDLNSPSSRAFLATALKSSTTQAIGPNATAAH